VNNLKILDCTLRDGGYVNKWMFGKQGIMRVIKGLAEAHIEIIECGFIRNCAFSEDSSVYCSMEQVAKVITPKCKNVLYAVMIEYHNHVEDLIPPYDGTAADIIRLTFRRKEWKGAKLVAERLIDKGYRVCIQPVGTTSYEDAALLSMIDEINQLNPYAFYLVDTLGIMYRRDVRRLFYLIDHNLAGNISIGFHSHNNLQMSFSNAQEILRVATNRSIIIDTSCYGMGRGVGNLPTELLADYINQDIENRYAITPILTIIDKCLMPIYAEQRWGYDLPYFLSGTLKCHPNYASYLMSKDALDINSIEKIISSLDMNERSEYNEELIKEIYLNYQKYEIDDSQAIIFLRKELEHKKILVLGPGKNVKTEKEALLSIVATEHPFVISVNYLSEDFPVDAMFISNEKRLSEIDCSRMKNRKVFMTSNLDCRKLASLVFNYSGLLGEGDALDNAAAMLIRLLKKVKVEKIYLAGLDGYSADALVNYSERKYVKALDFDSAQKKNKDISKQLKNALEGVEYEVVTNTKYDI